MKKNQRRNKIVLYVLIVAGAFIMGYSLGMMSMFGKCVNEAVRFLDISNMTIDKSLVVDYLHRAGL